MKNKLLTVGKKPTSSATLTFKSEKVGDRIKVSFSDGFYCYANRLSDFKMDDYLCSNFMRSLFKEDCVSDVMYLVSPSINKILAVLQECSVQRKNPTPYLIALKTPGILMSMLIHGYFAIMDFANIGLPVRSISLNDIKSKLNHYAQILTTYATSEQVLYATYAKDLENLRSKWVLIKKAQEGRKSTDVVNFNSYIQEMAQIELDAIGLTLMRFKHGKHSNPNHPDVRTAITRYFCLIAPNVLYGCFIDDHLFELLVDSHDVNEAFKVATFTAGLHITVERLATMYDDVAIRIVLDKADKLTGLKHTVFPGLGDDRVTYAPNNTGKRKGVN